MKVLLAGATGALGVPLVRRMIAAGHEVVGITRTEAGAGLLWDLGASSVIADALDRDALLRAVDGRQADAVMHQLKPDQVYNIVDDEPARWGDLVDALADAFALPKPLRLPGAFVRAIAPVVGTMMTRQSLRLSNAEAKAEFGWRPMVPTYRDGIALLVSARARPTDTDDADDDAEFRQSGSPATEDTLPNKAPFGESVGDKAEK